ncbi:hypothetical protein DL767_000462 [Monosporascus sp. MG133]|nr:hypothetical protein DL767_000462 [Monosporascus sp. MG133]
MKPQGGNKERQGALEQAYQPPPHHVQIPFNARYLQVSANHAISNTVHAPPPPHHGGAGAKHARAPAQASHGPLSAEDGTSCTLSCYEYLLRLRAGLQGRPRRHALRLPAGGQRRTPCAGTCRRGTREAASVLDFDADTKAEGGLRASDEVPDPRAAAGVGGSSTAAVLERRSSSRRARRPGSPGGMAALFRPPAVLASPGVPPSARIVQVG